MPVSGAAFGEHVDWLAGNWPVLVALMGLAAAWGKSMSEISELQNKQQLQSKEITELREADAHRREKLQTELEAIRIALTEIKAQLGIRTF